MSVHYGSRGLEGTNLVQPNSEKRKTKPPGRICEHPDCNTKLSIYNTRDRCGVHEDYQRVHPNAWMRGT